MILPSRRRRTRKNFPGLLRCIGVAKN